MLYIAIMKYGIALLLLLTTSFNGNSQELTASLKDLSFMTGNWFQKHEWGDMEEYWSEPMGNCMTSAFRCVKDGKAVFYEFMIIEQTEKIPVMKLRHFNPGSIGWEDKDNPESFPLVQLAKNKAVFAAADGSLRLTYVRSATDKLDITLEEKDKKGKWTTTLFNLVRH